MFYRYHNDEELPPPPQWHSPHTTPTSTCQMTPKQPQQQRRQWGLGDEDRGLRCRCISSPRYVFYYYFLHFLYYTNVLQVPQWRRTATTTTVMLTTHHSHLNMSKDPKTEMTMKVMRVGIRGQGLEMQTRLKPQVSEIPWWNEGKFWVCCNGF